ncbi:MAG TPA: hypothetical protein DEU93_05845 [Chitinophagaceae bacterium]|nr:hypothetical protein [Chitinophagaceae bacterium]
MCFLVVNKKTRQSGGPCVTTKRSPVRVMPDCYYYYLNIEVLYAWLFVDRHKKTRSHQAGFKYFVG